MSTAAWFWHSGATLALIDIASAVRFDAIPSDPSLMPFAVALMVMGLVIAFAQGALNAWEQFNANERRGETA